MITQELLKEYLHYDPETGIFTWIKKTGPRMNIKVGSEAGRIMVSGYVSIGLFGKGYRAHRLAWLYVYGTFPINTIDHINGIKTDNRIANLRDVTHFQNVRNQVLHRGGKLVGTTFVPSRGVWQSSIQINYKSVFLGYYGTEKEAHEVYMAYVHEHNLI